MTAMDSRTEKEIPAEELDLKKQATTESTEIDPTLEKRIRRKLDLHILPWIFVLWLFAFIDRSNIGESNASSESYPFNLAEKIST